MDSLTGEVSIRCHPNRIPGTSLHAEGSSTARGDNAKAALCQAATNTDGGQVLFGSHPRLAPILSNRRQEPSGLTEAVQRRHRDDQ